MQEVPRRAAVFRFGVFEADVASGELRKQGSKIRLQEQPFRILVMLLDRAGEVVTRDEICRNLWSADTFVDFEQGLGTAIKKLRQALHDDAETPRYIETLPKRGFRFLAPLEKPSCPGPLANADAAASEQLETISVPEQSAAPVTREPAVTPTGKRSRMLARILAGAAALLITAGTAVWQAGRTPAQDLWSGVMLGGPAKAFQPRLSPDGQLLAFLAFVDRLPQLAVMKPKGWQFYRPHQGPRARVYHYRFMGARRKQTLLRPHVGPPARNLLRAAARRGAAHAARGGVRT